MRGCFSGVLQSHYGEGTTHLAFELGPGPDGEEALEDVGGAEVELFEGPVKPLAIFVPVE